MSGRVLMIAYFFPPLGGAGVQRPLKFARYLPTYGWQPYILSVTDDPAYIHDTTLAADIPPDLPIARANNRFDLDRFALRLSHAPFVEAILNRVRGQRIGSSDQAIRARLRFLEIPDAKAGWILPAYRRGRQLLQGHSFDVICTTSAPYSCHLVGYLLKRATGIPWVADFRDEWAENPYAHYSTPLHRWLSDKLEAQVLRCADRVLSVSEPLVSLLVNHGADAARSVVITNGYDRDDIRQAFDLPLPAPDGCFRLAYSGTFYGLRTPETFMRALELLFADGLLSPDETRLRLIGRTGQYAFTRPEWQSVIEARGYLPHHQALAEMRYADVLLLIVPSAGGARSYPAKIFEYVAMQKPILALVPPDSVSAELIRTTHTGVVVAPDDLDGIRLVLRRLFTDWKAGNLAVQPNMALIDHYERRQLTKQLADLFDQLPEAASSR